MTKTRNKNKNKKPRKENGKSFEKQKIKKNVKRKL